MNGKERRDDEKKRGEPPSGARSPFAFPANKRLRKRSEFTSVQKSATRVTTKHFVFLLAAARSDDAETRIGITASKRIGNAVERNRAKRLVRETFRRSPAFFPRGLDVVVIVREGLADLAQGDVSAEWDRVRALVARRAAELKRPNKTS